jgi:acetyl esterase
MPLDPYVDRFLRKLTAARDEREMSVPERRQSLEELLSFAGVRPEVAEVRCQSVPGPAGPVPVRVYTPLTAEPRAALPGLIYFHGGGLVAGSLDSHDGICRALAHASGCRLLAVDYRLAPEHPFPAAIDDACAAISWIGARAAEFGIEADRVAICGDSAGATLAAVACQQCRLTAPGTPIALQFLLCPITDACSGTGSRRALAQGYFLDEATLNNDLKSYLGPDVSPADPRVSPLRAASLAGLPPACIHTAEFDPVRDEGAAYAERLRQAGVSVSYRCHSGMIHLFYGMGALIPYAAAAFTMMGADIRATLVGRPECHS